MNQGRHADARAHAADTDALAPFVVENQPVRGALIRLDATSRAILGQHAYPPPLARALAELLAAGALLASTLKLDGSLVVQLSGDGPVRLLVVECNDAHEMRATAQWEAAQMTSLGEDASLAQLAGAQAQSRLTLTLDERSSGTLYQGIVALDGDSIAASIEHYLATSEQLQSRLWLDARGAAVRGLLLQRLPAAADAEDATWTRLTRDADRALRATASPGRVDDAAAAPSQASFAAVLARAFPHDDVRLFAPRPVQFRCRCSAGRVANALRIAGRDEIEAALAERGIVEVTCEFCNRRYAFGAADARALFAARRADVARAREAGR
jgi:molecular chaperone Hsp33